MKQKGLAIFLSALLAAGMLTGCGGEKADTQDKTSETSDGNTESSKPVDEETASKAVSEEEAAAAGFTDGTEESGEDQNAFSEEGEGDTSEPSSGESETVILDTDSPLSGTHHAEIVVKDFGTIELELDADTAPISVTNFVKLAQEGFYDGLTFHRIISGFMIQGGDPLGNGRGGSEETIKGEFSANGVENSITHTRGTISMARSNDPNSASSQFFIVHEDSDFLDGNYAAFGHVTEGMDVVDAICEKAKPTDNNGTILAEDQPVMESVTIID